MDHDTFVRNGVARFQGCGAPKVLEIVLSTLYEGLDKAGKVPINDQEAQPLYEACGRISLFSGMLGVGITLGVQTSIREEDNYRAKFRRREVK